MMLLGKNIHQRREKKTVHMTDTVDIVLFQLD